MKLFCRDEMQRLEMAAVAAGVPLSQLMDNAGAAVAQEVERRCRPVGGKRAVVLCGKGNNGGDGFVCAKLLAQRGMACWVVLAQGKPATDLAAAAFDALPPQVAVLPGEELEQIRPVLEAADVLIDCVFGFSFRGELSGLPQKLLAYGSGLPCLKVSADLPSGVECDTGRVSAGAFRADVTVTFTGKKPANVSYPAKEFCGETVVRQVGVPAALVEGAETRVFETDSLFPRQWLPQPDAQANKGDMGKLLLVCGSWGMAGACVMAAQAALRSGVGLLTIAVEERLYPILAQAVPQAVYVAAGRRASRRCWTPWASAPPASWAAAWGSGRSWCVPWCSPTASGPWWPTPTPSTFSAATRGTWRGWKSPWCSPLTPGRWPGCAMTPSRKSSPTGWALPGRRPRKPAPWWR